MPQKGSVRFGRFLRSLREEHRLTLEQVQELSAAYPTRISSAYLCRCEKGLARPGADRLSVLARIFGTNTGFLLHRLETDEELEGLASEDMTKSSPEELLHRGRQLAERGDLRAALACFRGAEEQASGASSGTAMHVPQARLSMAVTLHRLAKYELAHQEAERAYAVMPIDSVDRLCPVLLMAICQQRLGNVPMAELFLNVVSPHVAQLPLGDQADIHLFRGNLHYEKGAFREAVRSYRQAAAMYRDLEDLIGEARARKNAANVYARLRAFVRAFVQGEAALQLSKRALDNQQIARCLLALGEIHYRAGEAAIACRRLLESIERARSGDYQDVLFASYFYLWKMEVEAGQRTASSTRRILRTILPKLQETLEEATEFRRLDAKGEEASHE